MGEAAVLEEVAEIFASLRDVDAALGRFLTLARRISGSPAGGIYLRDDGRGLFLRWAETPQTPMRHLPLPLIEQIFAGVDHRVVAMDEARFDGLGPVESARERGFGATLALTLRHDGRLVGILALPFASVAAVPQAALPTLTTVARFPAAAVEQARAAEVGARRARLADALRRFGERALGTLDVAALHRLILDTVVEMTGSDQASITEVQGGLVRVIAAVGRDERHVGSSAPAAMMAEALSPETPYIVPDVAAADATQHLVKLARKNGAASFMALAMRHQERVFGHLFAGAAEPHRYRDEEVEAMRILASMAAAVLEQRHAQAAVERLAGRLAATVEHLPMIIEVFDGNGDFVLGNRVARATRERIGMGGAPTAAAPIADMVVTELDGTPVAPEALPSRVALGGVRPEPRELVVYHDGRRIGTFMAAAAPIFAPDGSVDSVVLAGQDVTALHELAREKERFLRVAAHELRTPLTALHATTQLIEIDPSAFDDATRRQTTLGRIRRQTTRLVRLVEQLLDSVRMQSSELPLSRADVDLVALCRDVADTVMPPGGPRAVLRADGAVVGRWDPLRIEQVVTNLLSNAVRYSPPDGEIVVGARVEGGRALLSVRDSGIGIPAEQLPQLFTPFFRAANAQKSQAGGLGLGLHIAQEIVRRHGGRISVESRENEGTTFTVELPLEP